MASKRCKKTGDSQMSFKIANALARRSTLSRMCGLTNLELPADAEVDAGTAEDEPAAEEPPAPPREVDAAATAAAAAAAAVDAAEAKPKTCNESTSEDPWEDP